MKFPYIKVVDFPNHTKRERFLPWIRFGLYNPKDPTKLIYPLGLIDSGSDTTFINYELGEHLGFNVFKGVKSKVYGMGGGSIDVSYHKVGIRLKDTITNEAYDFVDMVGFTYGAFPNSLPQQTAILGTIGFFRHLTICFRYPIEILISS